MMIRSFKTILDLTKQSNYNWIANSAPVKLPQYQFSWGTKGNNQDDDDNVSFSDLLKQGDDNLAKQNMMEEKQRKWNEKYGNMDAREIYMKSIKSKTHEKELKDDEITRDCQPTFTYENKDNPFFNPETARIHSNMQFQDESIREWQFNFKKQHKRKPTLQEMLDDPTIGSIIAERQRQRSMLKASVFKYRIE